ncbi:MAG: hypothetical protein COZ76_05850 [Flavobacteriales bacterium CG_4_8_14_3_um_filter_35_10]|nr:MAG: hypothetical protein COZ76_05850 [Flavobacteriales bacterium CG_4_8_14_3_um_filter_35_10]
MIVAIMQPYFFPYIGYFQLINAVDVFVIYDDVNYIKKGWINRNRFLVNGQAQLFTIPLIEASQNKHIAEIELVGDLKWKGKLLKTIAFNYKKAPYFKDIYLLIESIVLFEEPNLSAYIHNSLIQICRYLDINTVIEPTSAKYQNGHLKAADKIMDICLQKKAQMYINPIGGAELYDKQVFMKNNIQLNFIQSEKIEYKQFNNEFVPWLSIIDLLMFNSKDEVRDLLSKYSLI